jgi:hypothetical protein
MEDSKEGFEGCKEWPPSENNMASMHELAMKVLCLFECVCFLHPLSDNGGQVFGFFAVRDGDSPCVDVSEETNV